ncbi:MAG TPA: 30S ribosomal protein S1 [Acholeplasmataceae bacterium]|nr:30S ribosomal protein S1 [Acholeplasmataceae bacterium]
MDIRVLKVGDIVEGKVVQVNDNTILLDVKYFTEAKMHLDNYDRPAPETFKGFVEVGQVIKCRVQKISEEPALILVSRLPLLKNENFKKIEEAVANETEVETRVKKAVDKGLLLSYLDHELFIPFSLLDFELIAEKDNLKGKKLTVQIIEATKKGRFTRIVATRKPIFEREKQEAYEQRLIERQEELDQIETGDVLKGTVAKLEKHAASIKFKNVVGLLRISQVSHYRIDKLEEVLKEGDEVEVKVIKKEGNRLDLSMKALQKTPYEEFYEKHKAGDSVKGTVFQKLPFGIIVELARDVRGLLHKNEYSWNSNDNLDDHLKIGDEITLSILNLDLKRERIALSKKALEDNPWKNVTLKRGEQVKAVIKKIDDEGLHVLVQGIIGLIPKNEVSGDQSGLLEAYYAIDDTVEAVVTEANSRNWVLKLSIKQIETLKARQEFEKYLEDETEESTGQTIGDLFADELTEK